MQPAGSPLLNDKVVLLSGVGPGLGVKAAHALAEAGAAVVCVARTAVFVEQVAADIRAAGGSAAAAPGDIASRADCRRIVEIAQSLYGRLDALVNSAYAVGPIVPFANADLDVWREVMEVNLFGTLGLIQASLPLLERDGGGQIVNVNTTSAIRPMNGQGAYSVSKAALEFATRQLAIELGASNIRVNTLYCGPMLGPSLYDAMDKWAERRETSRAQIQELVAANMALGRVPEDAEAARVLVALLSDHCRIITGASIHATGGAWVGQHI